METAFVTYRSAKLFYRITGKGKPVLLLHGFGEDGDIWQNQVDVLKENNQLVIPDLPGSGRSEMINDMSVEGIADAIKYLLEEVLKKDDTITLLGHSMGGYILLAFAEKYAGIISSFGLVHSSAFADNEEKISTREKAIEFIKKNGAYEFLKTSTPGLFKDPEGISAIECNSLIEKGRLFAPQALIAYYRAMINRPDRSIILKSFTQPILFIIGQHDKAIPFQQSLQQCYLPNQSHVHILRNSAHMGMIEEKEKVNNILEEFLAL